MTTKTIILEVDFEGLKQMCWSGALQTLEEIERLGIKEDFTNLINDVITNDLDAGIEWEDTTLNDFIWFDTDFIEEQLKVKLWEY